MTGRLGEARHEDEEDVIGDGPQNGEPEAACRQQQDAQIGRHTQSLKHFKAVDPRKRNIEQHEIILPGKCGFESQFAVMPNFQINLMARKILTQHRTQLDIIINDQD